MWNSIIFKNNIGCVINVMELIIRVAPHLVHKTIDRMAINVIVYSITLI